jgi:hypothetical protein
MSTIIKIAIAATVLTGTVQGARAAIKHYTFVDALQESMLFVGSRTEEELAVRVMEIAGDHQIPIDPANLAVRREAFLVTVDGTYTESVNILPGVYSRPWDFEVAVSVRQLEDTRPRGPSAPRRRR